MRVAFFGTPEFAVAALDALRRSRHRPVVVVTQRDRPRGRGLATVASPVKAAALDLGLPVLEPERLDAGFLEALAGFAPGVLAVVAYGKILPPRLLALAPGGAVNVHASLLPRHRGASPIQAAILAGDAETGVTTMRMDAGLDTGPMLLTEATPIGDREDAGSLGVRLAALGARLLVATLDRLEAGELTGEPQTDALATWAPCLTPQDARIDWSRPAEAIARQVRALSPAPGAYTTIAPGRRLKIARAEARSGQPQAPAGTVIVAAAPGIEVACGDGVLVVSAAQPEGKRLMTAAELVNGRQVRKGDRLGA